MKKDPEMENFASQLDSAIRQRKREHQRLQEDLAAQLTILEAFTDRAIAALRKAAQVIEERADALGFDSPVVVDGKAEVGNDAVSARVSVSMSPPSRARRGIQVREFSWNWSVSVYCSVDARDRRDGASFRIEAKRGTWVDAWGCDIPTAECDPKGLTLESSGEEVAQRFMAWFTKYLTR